MTGSPTTSDLVRRLTAVLAFAGRALTVLAEQEDSNAEETTDAPLEKIVAETAMLLLAAAPVAESNASVCEQVLATGSRLVPLARSARVLGRIRLQPAVALDFGAAHVCLSRLRLGDPTVDRVLATSLASPVASMRERLPYRQLEADWLAMGSGAGGTPVDCGAARSVSTALGRGLDALVSSRDDVYAFTHALLYLSDFGRRLPDLPRRADLVVGDAECALASALDQDDFDLAGELLMTWPLLRIPWTAAATFAFSVLARLEDEAGFLPPLSLEGAAFSRLEGAQRRRYAFASSYHTPYVMGLLCALILSAGRLPAWPPETNASEAADAIVPLLGQATRPPRWEQDFAAMPRARQGLIAPLLLDVAIHRAVRRLDLVAIREALVLARRWGILASPSVSQSADLLRRCMATAETAEIG